MPIEWIVHVIGWLRIEDNLTGDRIMMLDGAICPYPFCSSLGGLNDVGLWWVRGRLLETGIGVHIERRKASPSLFGRKRDEWK
jgi:hypothetical protein